MERSKYDRATLFLKYIEHLNNMSEFICTARETNKGLELREIDGLVNSSRKIELTEADVDMFLITIEKEKKELEEAFAAL